MRSILRRNRYKLPSRNSESLGFFYRWLFVLFGVIAKNGMQILASINSSMALILLSKEMPISRWGSRGISIGVESRGNASLSNLRAPDGETMNAQVPNIFCSLQIETSACE